MFSIGEFSRITGLTVKTLRFYHERGVLTPALVDPETGYRYYDRARVERARVISQLRALEFSLEDIGDILSGHDDQADVLDLLDKQMKLLKEKVQRQKVTMAALERIIHHEREAREAMQNAIFEVVEKSVDKILIAGIRMKAKYSDCCQAFSKIGRSFGRYLAGKPFLLQYDNEYKEIADFEACFPISKSKAVEGISVRELPGGRCVSLMHKGPWEELSQTYAKIFSAVKAKNYEIQIPSREIYVKGPGIIFRGNPKNYLTELQMMLV